MRRTSKSCLNKGAFTLVEMVLVLGVIVILASVLIIGISQFFNAADTAMNEVENESAAVVNNIDRSEQKLRDYGF